jgi:hypothetical protein
MRVLHMGLLLLPCLMLFTASASAECAWVLWEHTWPSSGPAGVQRENSWTPTGAVATVAECTNGQAGMEKRYKLLRRLRLEANVEPDVARNTQWICLPDTVDPRGAKGN